MCKSIISIDFRKHMGNSVSKILVNIPLFLSPHIHIYHHNPLFFQMLLHQSKKLQRRHLKGYGNVLVGIHHNHVILSVNHIQVCPPVIGCDFYFLRHLKILFCQFRDFPVNLHPFHTGMGKISFALPGKGPRPVSKH